MSKELTRDIAYDIRQNLLAWLESQNEPQLYWDIADYVQQLVLSALREREAEKLLPDSEGPWWEWKHGSWDMHEVFQSVRGFYWCTSFENRKCSPGRWVRCPPPSPRPTPALQTSDATFLADRLYTPAEPSELGSPEWCEAMDAKTSPPEAEPRELVLIEEGRLGGHVTMAIAAASIAEAEQYIAAQWPQAVRNPEYKAFWEWTAGDGTPWWVRAEHRITLIEALPAPAEQ